MAGVVFFLPTGMGTAIGWGWPYGIFCFVQEDQSGVSGMTSWRVIANRTNLS